MIHEAVVESLKTVLKSKKISYGLLANEIGMSESGLKKLLNAKDISLNRLLQISNAIGVPLVDLMNLAHEEEIKNVTFTIKQEEALLSDFLLFRVLWRLCIEGKSEEETIKLESLTQRKLTSYTLKLENLDLVKVNKMGKVVSVHGGLYRWSGGSKLLNKLNKEWSRNTLNAALRFKDEEFHQLSFLELTSSSKNLLHEKLNQVVDEFARLSRRERIQYPKGQLIPTSLLIATAQKGFLE